MPTTTTTTTPYPPPPPLSLLLLSPSPQRRHKWRGKDEGPHHGSVLAVGCSPKNTKNGKRTTIPIPRGRVMSVPLPLVRKRSRVVEEGRREEEGGGRRWKNP